ncbi:MAG: hypothetical protein RR397_05275 [Odoribacter sp.]
MENIDDKYKEKRPFKVPDDYFDNLTDRIMNNLERDKKEQRLRLIPLLKPYLGLVAIFMLALFVVQVIIPRFIDKDQMLMKRGEQIVQVQDLSTEVEEEIPFDSQFNPTNEEIIEYLTSEVNSYELMYAGIY